MEPKRGLLITQLVHKLKVAKRAVKRACILDLGVSLSDQTQIHQINRLKVVVGLFSRADVKVMEDTLRPGGLTNLQNMTGRSWIRKRTNQSENLLEIWNLR